MRKIIFLFLIAIFSVVFLSNTKIVLADAGKITFVSSNEIKPDDVLIITGTNLNSNGLLKDMYVQIYRTTANNSTIFFDDLFDPYDVNNWTDHFVTIKFKSRDDFNKSSLPDPNQIWHLRIRQPNSGQYSDWNGTLRYNGQATQILASQNIEASAMVTCGSDKTVLTGVPIFLFVTESDNNVMSIQSSNTPVHISYSIPQGIGNRHYSLTVARSVNGEQIKAEPSEVEIAKMEDGVVTRENTSVNFNYEKCPGASAPTSTPTSTLRTYACNRRIEPLCDPPGVALYWDLTEVVGPGTCNIGVTDLTTNAQEKGRSENDCSGGTKRNAINGVEIGSNDTVQLTVSNGDPNGNCYDQITATTLSCPGQSPASSPGSSPAESPASSPASSPTTSATQVDISNYADFRQNNDQGDLGSPTTRVHMGKTVEWNLSTSYTSLPKRVYLRTIGSDNNYVAYDALQFNRDGETQTPVDSSGNTIATIQAKLQKKALDVIFTLPDGQNQKIGLTDDPNNTVTFTPPSTLKPCNDFKVSYIVNYSDGTNLPSALTIKYQPTGTDCSSPTATTTTTTTASPAQTTAPTTEPATTPAQTTAPNCTEVRQYNECTACSTSRRISLDSCGVGKVIITSQDDPGCSSLCPANHCTEVRQYNECTGCNTSKRISQDNCGGYKTVVQSQPDGGCSNLCPANQCTVVREYAECIGPQTSRVVQQDSCGGYKVTVPSRYDAACD